MRRGGMVRERMINLLKFWRQIKGPFLYGQALMRFQQGRFAECARKLEEVCAIDASEGSPSFRTYAYLGRSYFALGEREKALARLSRAYELFDLTEEDNLEPGEIAEVVKFLDIFKQLLLESEQP
jgi:tetratricopeptide (TPR) repeat protein